MKLWNTLSEELAILSLAAVTTGTPPLATKASTVASVNMPSRSHVFATPCSASDAFADTDQ